ncbi:MAG: DegT/DnrJ/EryC1/StrS family aminotransferase, partial [Candidatus Omnitrophota bacterium]
MVNKIEHSGVMLNGAERKALIKLLVSRYLAEGKEVRRLEQNMSRNIGTDYAIAASTGTAALHLALLALGIKDGDEVIIPNYVCRSVLNAVQYVRARPVLCDVDLRTFNILPDLAKKLITPKTKAVIAAHMFGCPADMDLIKKMDIFVIEDCAQSIGAEY